MSIQNIDDLQLWKQVDMYKMLTLYINRKRSENKIYGKENPTESPCYLHT